MRSREALIVAFRSVPLDLVFGKLLLKNLKDQVREASVLFSQCGQLGF
jgi:hypothetical protein